MLYHLDLLLATLLITEAPGLLPFVRLSFPIFSQAKTKVRQPTNLEAIPSLLFTLLLLSLNIAFYNWETWKTGCMRAVFGN